MIKMDQANSVMFNIELKVLFFYGVYAVIFSSAVSTRLNHTNNQNFILMLKLVINGVQLSICQYSMNHSKKKKMN